MVATGVAGEPVFGQATSSKPAETRPAITVTDAQVDRAIRRGVDYLYSSQAADGSWDTRYKQLYPGGAEALAVLAALAAGDKPDARQIKSAVDYIGKAQPMTVYARATRCVLYARLGKDYAGKLNEDVQWLIRQQASGGWGYGPGHPTMQQQPKWVDNSNSQFALFALAEAAEAGAAVPGTVWKNSLAYWAKAQNADGGWGYEPPINTAQPLRKSSYGSMTAAGAATLFALEEHLAGADGGTSRPAAERDALPKAVKWLNDNYSSTGIPKWLWGVSDIYMDYFYVYLFSLARTAEAGGIRNFGASDWYPEMAAILVAKQRTNGSWADPEGPDAAKPGPAVVDDMDAPVRTSFAVLALAKARTPVLLDKLMLEGEPPFKRDAADLVRGLGRALEWQVGWQAIGPNSPPAVLGEAPVLYVNAIAEQFSDGAWNIPPKTANNIHQFVMNGGTVLVNPVGGDAKLAQSAAAHLQALLPEMRAAPLADDHPVWGLKFNIDPQKRTKIIGIGDSARTAVFVLTADLAASWAADKSAAAPQDFELPANIVLYATDKTPPAGKLEARRRSGSAAGSAAPVVRWIGVARVRHAGDWSICPAAMRRVSDALASAVSVGVKDEPPVDLSKDVPASLPLLWLTGSQPLVLDAAARDRLKKYVLGGGTVFVDSAVGRKEFADSALAMVEQVFGKDKVRPIPDDDPLLTGKFSDLGLDVTAVSYSPALVAEQPKLTKPALWGVAVNGRWGVIFSPYGLTCPAQGAGAYGLKGYSRDDACRLALNIVLYAATKHTGTRE
ncbi:MAG: DUF4159 domain-containing protein [Phycisphaerae bacterium]